MTTLCFRNFVVSLAVSSSFLAGCSTTSNIQPFSPEVPASTATMQKGLVFSLPKTVLEIKITYSEYLQKTWEADPAGNPKKTGDNGKPIAPKATVRLVRVDKPFELTPKTVSDPAMRFVYDTESLNGFTKATDITVDLSSSGLLKSTNAKVEDKTGTIVSNVISGVVNLAKLAAVAGTDVNEFILVRDVVVTRAIDPSDLTFSNAVTPAVFSADYSDKIRGEKIFAGLRVPEVKVHFASKIDISPFLKMKSIDFIKGEEKNLGGFPYRVGYPLQITVSVDGVESVEANHLFAQAGSLAVLPLNARSFSDVTQGLTFADDTGSLTKFVQKNTSRGEAISGTVKDAIGSVTQGILDVQQAKIDRLTKDKALIDAEIALSDAKKKKAASE